MYDALFKNTLAPLVLRLCLAAIFIYHGLDKIVHHDVGATWATDTWKAKQKVPPDVMDKLKKLPQETKDQIQVEYSKATNEPMPSALEVGVAQIAVAWGELLGGLAMLVGVLTRIAALGLIALMAGAIYTVTLEHGFAATAGGYEYNVAIVAMSLALFFWGGGALSVDHIFRRRRKTT